MDAQEKINKSLEEVEKLSEMSESLSKSEDSKEVAPNEVSENAPEESQGGSEGDDPVSSQEDTDADSEGQEDAGEDDSTEKSLESVLSESDTVQQSLEVSDFLQELVKGIDSVLSKHQDTLSKSIEGNSQTQDLLAKSFEGIVKSQQAIVNTTARLQKSITELNNRIEKVERTPIKKSVTNANVIEKSFEASAGNKEDASKQLTKSQIGDKLFEGLQEQKIDENDLYAFEATGSVGALSPKARNYLGI